MVRAMGRTSRARRCDNVICERQPEKHTIRPPACQARTPPERYQDPDSILT
jgi:hypothetical protein